MTAHDPKELKEHIRWLEDELSAATNFKEDLENIDGALTEIKSDLGGFVETFNHNTDELKRLFDAFNAIAGAINRNTEVLNKLVDGFNQNTEMLKHVFARESPVLRPNDTTNKPKERAANPKPHKTKLSVVSKDDDDGPAVRP